MTMIEIERFIGQAVTVSHRYRLAPNGVATDNGVLYLSGDHIIIELDTEEDVRISPEKIIEIKAGRH